MRSGSVQGVKHRQQNINNQDACLYGGYRVPSRGCSYQVGLVSDGCTGIPRFSRTEVGANLLVIFAYSRIQEFISAGLPVTDIPRSLFQSVTEFIRDLTQRLMPGHIHWPYEMQIPDRKHYTGAQRIRADYFSATLLGFISDGETIVTFSSGDGIIVVNDDVMVIDQNDQPNYPSLSINSPNQGFDTTTYVMEDVNRIAVMTDGPSQLLEKEPSFLDKMFAHLPTNQFGLDILLKVSAKRLGHLMSDDCTAVTLEKKVNT